MIPGYTISEIDGVPQKRNRLPVWNGFAPESITSRIEVTISDALNVDGSGGTLTYGRFALASLDQYIYRMMLLIEDDDSQFDDFMGRSALANGCQFRIKSEDVVINPYTNLQTTWDIFSQFSEIQDYFYLVKETNSKHYVTAIHDFRTPVIIKAVGTYAFDDYIVIDIRDNLTGLTQMKLRLFGYTV